MIKAAAAGRTPRDFLGLWCGALVIFTAVLTPLFAWLWPMGFPALLALVGLLSLPAIRITDDDRPALVALLALLVWAAASTAWSPFHPDKPDKNVALKLALQLPLYWSAICGARRADPRLRRIAAWVFAGGAAALGALLLVEAFTEAGVYRALRDAFYEPMRTDLAKKNMAQATFILALLWPVATMAVARKPWHAGLAILGAVGTALSANLLLSDAPTLAAPLAVVVILAVWKWPVWSPRVMAAAATFAFMLMPLAVLGLRETGDYDHVEKSIQLSWGMRLGYWDNALDWILDHPIRGWGLDASRTMGPGIQLHPHNGALQIWLELGGIGALFAALFWGFTLLRLGRARASLMAAGAAGSAAVYLLFGLINFGVWQEWWLALGALACVIAAGLPPHHAPEPST